MTIRKGVCAVLAVLAVYATIYWYHVITVGLPFDAKLSYFVGSSAAICMVMGIILSARPRRVEGSFGGLDKMYKLHKYLGVAALLLFIAHFATVPGGGPDEDETATPAVSIENAATPSASAENAATPSASAENGTTSTVSSESGATSTATPEAPAPTEESGQEEGLPIDILGLVAMIGFTLLIIVTLNRKFPYHRWITTHRFMGLFFIVVSAHIFLALYEDSSIALFSAPGVVLALLLLAGLVAFGYKQIVYPKKEKHGFELVAVNRLERATEVVLKPKSRMFSFEPGQFAFITIDADGFKEAHPFTISSGSTEDGLRFTMKTLGDYTRRVRNDLTAGADVEIEGPYGRFNPMRGGEKQVWVAGGIGITPFLSVMRTLKPGHGKTIRFYYCVRTEREALFFDELETRAAEVGGVSISRFDSDVGALLDADAIKNDIGEEIGDWDFYFCGPKPMTVAISKGLIEQGVSARRIHKEEFEFR